MSSLGSRGANSTPSMSPTRAASGSLSSNKNSADPTPTRQRQTYSAPSYETFAPRSAAQRERMGRIAALTAGPWSTATNSIEEQKESSSDFDEPITLTAAMCPPKSSTYTSNSGSNDSTFSSVTDQKINNTLQHTINATQNLSTLIKHTASLRLALRASINIANDVSERHSDLLRHSGELSAAAERLQHEEQVLTRRAEEIGKPLKHYDAVDRIGPLVGVLFKEGGKVVVRGIAKLHVDNDEEFVRVLEEIDEAVEFFGEDGGGAEIFGRPGSGGIASNNRRGGRERTASQQPFQATASGSAEYYRRACALQDAALELLRVGVADRISQTSSQIQDALKLPKVPIAADKLEASLVYTRFHGISRRSNALINIARKRVETLGSGSLAASSYEDFLTLCRNTYCGARETLLTTTIRSHMDILKNRHGLVGMTRLASVFLIRLCTVETALYLDFFGDPDKRQQSPKKVKGTTGGGGEDEKTAEENEGGNDASVLKRLGSSSSQQAGTAIASQVLSEDATYRDAEFQSMLGSLCSALHRTIRRGLVSVLDLDVLCQVVSVLREERSAANSTSTTLAAARAVSGVIQDAQERLIFCANTSLHKEVVRFKPTAADLNYPGKLLGEKPKPAIIVEDEEGKGEAAKKAEKEEESEINDAVAAQLRVYESWFPPMRSVLRILSKIFRVVEPRVFEDIALSAVQACTKSLKDGSSHILRASGQIHADLFLVKHLLILREQLSPFDIQLRSVERQLDFSEAGKAVSRFLANRNRRLFSMSTENALVTLLREGVSVQESSVDSKRDLEDCLRSACNDFIEHTTSSLLGPISKFVDQCKNEDSIVVLRSKSFMNGIVVKGMFGSALANFESEFGNVSTQMKLYLENSSTQSILLKPVVRKITRALEEARRFIDEVPDDENDWDADLREEVLNSVSTFETRVKAATSTKQGSN
eukprot:CAMPEP_0201693134 /NCGR_PEP_ID=MMETSP0578-20130828/5813_1 /ASSEMBLY_ACC=CAM_ASM_000663 /TAXON_ID=267565 /ORGANISM="Skeletonema grethea, Strain CCMP 1804" /LENGTH=938 /DNA_ID=CAMNT_0048178611 /DNA_START=71 /DNA_END=2887 /DNA_ORIENTATION=-